MRQSKVAAVREGCQQLGRPESGQGELTAVRERRQQSGRAKSIRES
jgi:hypothetical protein